MRVYRVDTINFSFQVFAEDLDGFVFAFKQGWHKHCRQYQIPVDDSFVQELINENTDNYVDCICGAVYRDSEELI